MPLLVWQNALEMKSATAAGAVNKVAICDKSGKYCVDVFPAGNMAGENRINRIGVLSLQG